MKKKTIIIVSIAILLVMCAAAVYVSANPTEAGQMINAARASGVPDEVIAIAKKETETLRGIAASHYEFKLEDEDDAAQLQMGGFIRTYGLGGDAETLNAPDCTMFDLAADCETWIFTLDLNGVPKAMMRIAFWEGRYQRVGYYSVDDDLATAITCMRDLAVKSPNAEFCLFVAAGITDLYVVAVENGVEYAVAVSDFDPSVKSLSELPLSAQTIEHFRSLAK